MIGDAELGRLTASFPEAILDDDGAWLAERGVARDALERWCMAQTIEDIQQLQAEHGGDPTRVRPIKLERIAAQISTGYHMGVLMGLRIAELER